MPIDPQRRMSDLTQALTLMLEAQGDEALNGISFSSSESKFAGLAHTTWRELVDAGLIEDRGEKPGPTFRLTPHGWLTGLEVSGALDRQDIRDRAIAMRRALKAKVKGRREHYGAHVDVREFSREIGLPVGWVWSAMRSNLLQTLFPDDLMNATLDPRSRLLIEIPPTFDMDRIA
jgi:hypothetical protein